VDRHQIEYSVERLCNKGCKAVRQDMAALERGEVLAEVADLNATERAQVLKELSEIMAVYGDTCRIY